MNRPIHFEIPVAEPERAAAFYTNVFQWKITKWPGPADYWIVDTGEGPGINGGLIKRPGAGNGGTINTIDVVSVDEHTELAVKHGAVVCVPKMAIPGVGWLVYCQDTEGNVFGMMQADPAAQ